MRLLPHPRRLVVERERVDPSRLRLCQIVDRVAIDQPQGYRLDLSAVGIRLLAHDEAGLFYGRQTLSQLLREPTVPACVIEDWPDYPVRGVMLDISRDKVPTMATLKALVDLLASLKINQLQLYTEHTFAYRNHRAVWEHASPMTHDQVRELDAYCGQRHVELVPNQNSFGHLTRWLIHPDYRHLAECPDGYVDPWGRHRPEPMSLCPIEPGSLALLTEWFDELLPCFTSKQVNVGCDETWDLGQGRSKSLCDAVGVGRVYLQFLRQLHERLAQRGRTMQFWADILLKHPELVDELPRDVVALIWGYEADHAFEPQCARVAASGRPFYVCPGTSSWCSLAGRTDNMLANLRAAAVAGLRHGAIGLLITDWGDQGHLQPLPVSYAGFAYGAAVAWCVQANAEPGLLASSLNRHVFLDPNDCAAQAWLELGNVSTLPGLARSNGTVLFDLLVQARKARPDLFDSLENARARIAQARRLMASARPSDPAVTQEFDYATSLMESACRIGLGLPVDAEALRVEHQKVWLMRNRPGGLADSAARLPSS